MYGIAVENDDVYSAGVWEHSRDSSRVLYWKNAEITELPLPANSNIHPSSFLRNIIVENGNVYIAGIYCYQIGNVWHRKPCYWKGTERIDIPLTSTTNMVINLADMVVENGEA